MSNAVCHVIQRESLAINFDRVEITFILALFYWLKPFTDEDNVSTKDIYVKNQWRVNLL